MQRKKLKRRLQRGFTLLELMIVIVIVGILVGIAIPNFAGAMDRAKISTLKGNMHTFQTLLETYGVDYGAMYPTDVVAFEAQARAEGYWKEFKNPITEATGNEGSFRYNPTGVFGNQAQQNRGKTIFHVNPNNLSRYDIYGRGREGFLVLHSDGNPYSLTNGL